MTFTSRDLRDQIVTATDASDGEYNVDAIVEEIIEKHGATDVDTLDTDEFWQIVGKHAIDQTTYTARLDITDVYGELHGAVIVLPEDLPPMEPTDSHEEMHVPFLIGSATSPVDRESPAIRQAEGFLAAHRWQLKGTWQSTEDGYTVPVGRA